MVDPPRPPSRSGRSTRNNPLPDPPEAEPATAAPSKHASATKTTKIVPKTRRPRASLQSNTLLRHGFTRRSSISESSRPTGPAKPAKPAVAAGRKRTRSSAAAGQDPAEEKSPVKELPVPKRGRYGKITNGVTNNVKFEEDVQLPKKKVINGERKLAASPVDDADENVPVLPLPKKEADKRTLRSQDGTSRLNSDLAIYFNNFDDIMNDVDGEPEPLMIDQQIHIIDEPLKSSTPQSTLPLRGKSEEKGSPSKTRGRRSSQLNGKIVSPKSPKHSMNGAQPLDLTPITSTYSAAQTQPDTDPLPDSHFFLAHRRAERKEKQLRNIEREHASHEKVQLDSLLDGLQGPDWLRVMGITGITEGERQDWKPKRNYFIKEVKALVKKFTEFRDEEKRMKLERDAHIAAEASEAEWDEEDEEELEEAEADEGVEEEEVEGAEEEREAADDTDDEDVASSGLNSSDLDASAALQLLEEASMARRRPDGRRPVKPTQKLLEVKKPPPGPPFTSFYPAPHLRAQALGKQRHGGRKEMAFGRPVPDVADADFELPKELTGPGALRDHARKKRRLKRDVEEEEEEEIEEKKPQQRQPIKKKKQQKQVQQQPKQPGGRKTQSHPNKTTTTTTTTTRTSRLRGKGKA